MRSLLESAGQLLRGKVVLIPVVFIAELGLSPTVRCSSVHQLEGASDRVNKALLAGQGARGAWASRVGRDGGQRLDGKATLKAQPLGVPHFLFLWFWSSGDSCLKALSSVFWLFTKSQCLYCRLLGFACLFWVWEFFCFCFWLLTLS